MRKSRIIGWLMAMGIVLVALSGCGGGGGEWNPTQAEADITRRLDLFGAAVEAYDVNGSAGMLSVLNEADFTLTIAEGDWSYDKSYGVLQTELNEDATNQLAWRRPVADGGHAYVLEMAMGAPVFSGLNSDGGIATNTFEVYESASGIPRTKTDNGTIVWTMAMVDGQWKVTQMTITFQPLSSGVDRTGKASQRGGFGLGSFGTGW